MPQCLGRFGDCIGLAFQITDDVLDVTQSCEQLGKTPGKDQAAHKATYPAVHGLPAAVERARDLTERAVRELDGFSGNPEVLKALAWFSVTRQE
jgi:geranylgeranyl diphosphate synthase type II